ncbi:MAG: DUF1122 family protein, partial [Dehalococcoidia bacterium]
MTLDVTAGLWRPAGETAEHPLARIDGADVGQGVRLDVEVGPRDHAGATRFRAYLHAADLGRTLVPVLTGRLHQGAFPAANWVEVTHFNGQVPVAGGEVDIPEGIDLQILQALGGLVPPGGALAVEYDSPHRRLTARALAQRVPPVATPLGGMMFAVGCGVAFKDWSAAGGGVEGPRKLQGYRAVDIDHQTRRGHQTLAAL